MNGLAAGKEKQGTAGQRKRWTREGRSHKRELNE
jgi:hypothetical protein